MFYLFCKTKSYTVHVFTLVLIFQTADAMILKVSKLKDHCISEDHSLSYVHVIAFFKHFINYKFYDIFIKQTDDKGVFSTSLTEEYQLVAVTFDLSPNDLWRLSLDSMNYAFCEEHLKEKLREKWKAAKPGMEKQFNLKL